MFQVPRFWAHGTILHQKTKNVLRVVKLTHTKTVQIKKKENQSAQIVGDLMFPIIKAVLHTKMKLLGST